tara:strand:+ start:1484 stop:1732 length:249 start_codon:yes stop_codon:yes gene_type:complete
METNCSTNELWNEVPTNHHDLPEIFGDIHDIFTEEPSQTTETRMEKRIAALEQKIKDQKNYFIYIIRAMNVKISKMEGEYSK